MDIDLIVRIVWLAMMSNPSIVPISRWEIFCDWLGNLVRNPSELNAAEVVNSFDQANTGGAVERIPTYGVELKQTIETLRKHLTTTGNTRLIFRS